MKLHNPIYAIAWFIGRLEKYIELLEDCYCSTNDCKLADLIIRIRKKETSIKKLFVSNYQLIS